MEQVQSRMPIILISVCCVTAASAIAAVFCIDVWPLFPQAVFGYDYNWWRLIFDLAFLLVALCLVVAGLLVFWVNRLTVSTGSLKAILLILVSFTALITGVIWSIKLLEDILIYVKLTG